MISASPKKNHPHNTNEKRYLPASAIELSAKTKSVLHQQNTHQNDRISLNTKPEIEISSDLPVIPSTSIATPTPPQMDTKSSSPHAKSSSTQTNAKSSSQTNAKSSSQTDAKSSSPYSESKSSSEKLPIVQSKSTSKPPSNAKTANKPYMGQPKIFSLAEINQHDQPDDLWMIIYNKVYDVTTFTHEHPGGAEVLFDCGGVDATEPFEDVAHSDHALNILTPYYIGELHQDECVSYSKLKDPSQGKEKLNQDKKKKRAKAKKKRSQQKFIERLSLCFLVALIGLTLVFYVYLQKSKWSSL